MAAVETDKLNGAVESPVAGVLRRLVLSGDFTEVSADDLISKDCRGDVEAAPDGTLYYANATEIRRLVPESTGSATETTN